MKTKTAISTDQDELNEHLWRVFMKYSFLFSIITFPLLSSCADLNQPISGRLTVQTDDYKILSGLEFEIKFAQNEMYHARTGNWYKIQQRVLDDTNSTTFDGDGWAVFVELELDGYWKSLIEEQQKDRRAEDGRWVPAEMDLQMLLRRKINPRPLYVKTVTGLSLELLDTPYGFDLEIGDLTRPHGRGRRADLFFTLTGEIQSDSGDYDVSLKIGFPNEADGIIPVQSVLTKGNTNELVLGQTAPSEGYLPELTIIRRFRRTNGREVEEGSIPPLHELSRLEGYWFRTHTEINENSEIGQQARHGKIFSIRVAPIFFMVTPTRHGNPASGNLSFSYFFAPDHSRSLEFNGTNLTPRPPGYIGNYYPLDKH